MAKRYLPHILMIGTCICAASMSLSQVSNGSGNGRLMSVDESLKRHGIDISKPELIRALKNVDSEVRWLAAQKLADEKAVDAVPAIGRALASEKVVITKINIAFAFAQLGDRKGFETLQTACKSSELAPHQRLMAAGYLVDLQDKACLGAAMSILRSRADADLRIQALSLLPRFRPIPEAESSAVHGLLRDSLQDSVAAMRISACNALLILGDHSDIKLLQDAIASEKDPTVRKQMQLTQQALRDKFNDRR
jgi:HEAT repeat protein